MFLNVHIHALVLDGVFARAEDGRLAFHVTPSLTDADVADVLAAIEPGVTRLLARLSPRAGLAILAEAQAAACSMRC